MVYFLSALVYLIAGLRVAQEYERAVVFRLGRAVGIRGPGLYWILPLFEWPRVLDTRTRTVTIDRQETMTKDSVTVKIDAVVWFHIADPQRAVVAVEDFQMAVRQIALTSLRNIVGQHALDEVLKDRTAINAAILGLVEEATGRWGISVETVEMKDVEIPEMMQRAMAREAEAVREKRARIIKSLAEKEAAETLAEGARLIAGNPVALELRRLQMLTEIGAENNTTTIIMVPSELLSMARSIGEAHGKHAKSA